MTAAPAKTRSGARAPCLAAGETHTTSRLLAPAARAATGATAPKAHESFVAEPSSSPEVLLFSANFPRTPSTAPPTVTVTATPPDAPPRGGACASAHGVGAAATRAAFAASSPERVSSPSAASAIFASPPPTPSSAASGGVSHVASAPETTRAGADAVGFPFPLAPVPGDEKTHRSGGDAATPNPKLSADPTPKNASPESVATAPPSTPAYASPAATRETRGAASRAKTTSWVVPTRAAVTDAGATPETRTEAKTPDAPASRIDDGAHATRDANAVGTLKFRGPSRSVRRGSRAFFFSAFSASPQASRSSHAPATSSHPPDARVAAEGISAWIRAAGTTERRSRDGV